MARVIEGETEPRGRRFAVVVARFNTVFTDKLLRGCVETLHQRGVAEDDVEVVHVPGAVEIPVVAAHLASSGRFAAIVALGCVIRGDTPHFDYVCDAASRGTTDVSIQTGVPVIFGVLTVENLEQARERTEGAGNKGIDAALAALETADVVARIVGDD